jgi:sugar lactone lactonase YvrE
MPHVILRGVDHPDDLVFDTQERLIFSDARSGLVGRVNAKGSVTVLLSGLAAPEGLVVLKDGTLIIAEQGPNRILALAPGATTPKVLRVLPGTPSTAHCKHGVDGIALDQTNDTLIIPDSPTGAVYRMSLDGKTLTLLASGITRPVGAAVDAQGTVYVADECGGVLWTIAANGKTTRIGGFGMLDDVVLDTHGNVLVTDLAPAIHALIRLNLATGRRETLASRGYIEPQGLVLGPHDTIYLSDDFADVIVEYIPA